MFQISLADDLSLHRFLTVICVLLMALYSLPKAQAEEEISDPFQDRREDSVPTSLFGTYLKAGELVIYPFYEYTSNEEDEYHPSELGSVGDTDFFGRLIEQEALIFIGYGLSDSLALEFEAALWTSTSLDTAPEDMSSLPDRLEETGLGDVESQLRWVWRKETRNRPAFYSFFEVVFPFQQDRLLIGTQEWEFAAGTGIIRGFDWGTLNGRVSVKYEVEDGKVEPGEYAIEYLNRVSERWRLVATLEGEDDEVSFISEAQWFVRPNIMVKLNNGFGISKKAPDWAPEVGVIFSF